MADIANVLLRITGSSGDARRDLQQTAAEAEAFDRINAEAEADVDTAIAKAKIKELRAELAVLARQSIEIDVDVDRPRMREIASQISSLTSHLGELGADGASATGGLRASILGLTGSLGRLGPIAAAAAPALIAAFFSMAAAVGALVTALAFAAGGLAALATAGFGALLVTIGGVVGAIQRFKQQSDIAGTAANSLKRAFDGIKSAGKSLLPAFDPALRAVADGIRSIGQAASFFKPVVVGFGRDAADAIRLLFDQLRSPAIGSGIAQLIALTGQALRPAVAVATQLGQIFLNLANGAMPALIAALARVSSTLQGWVSATSNAQAVRSAIEGMVGFLGQIVGLGAQVGRVLLNFFKATAPAARQVVSALTNGARALADWLGSAQGVNRVNQFMEVMIPLAGKLAEYVGRAGLALAQIGELAGPGLSSLLDLLNNVLTVLNFLLEKANQVAAAIRDIGSSIPGLSLPGLDGGDGGGFFGGLVDAATGAIPGIGQAQSAFDGLAGSIDSTESSSSAAAPQMGALSSAVSGTVSPSVAAKVAAGNLAGAWRSAMGAINQTNVGNARAQISSLITAVAGIVSQVPTQLRTLGTVLTNALRGGLLAGRPGVIGTAGNLITAFVNTFSGGQPKARGAGRDVGRGAGTGARGQGGFLQAAGDFLGNALTGGVRSKEGAARSGGRELGAGAKSGAAQGGQGMESVGSAIGNAFGTGILGVLAGIVQKVTSVIADLKAKMAAASKGSPKFFTYYLGRDIGRQFAEGLRVGQATVAGAAQSLALTSVASISPILAPAAAPGGAGGVAQTNIFNVEALEPNDPGLFLSQVDAKLRARGSLGR